MKVELGVVYVRACCASPVPMHIHKAHSPKRCAMHAPCMRHAGVMQAPCNRHACVHAGDLHESWRRTVPKDAHFSSVRAAHVEYHAVMDRLALECCAYLAQMPPIRVRTVRARTGIRASKHARVTKTSNIAARTATPIHRHITKQSFWCARCEAYWSRLSQQAEIDITGSKCLTPASTPAT